MSEKGPEYYDYIIAGAGCAGLALADALLASPVLRDKRILLLDHDFSEIDERTWCFWETEAGPYEHLVRKKWDSLTVFDDNGKIPVVPSPYEYKMVPGRDFRLDIHSRMDKRPENVTLLETEVLSVSPDGTVRTKAGNFCGGQVFDSRFPDIPDEERHPLWLWQHFKGYFVRTDEDFFDDRQATLMDFRTEQFGYTRFFYVLPLSPREALVEYTVFSPELLSERKEYDEALREYIGEKLGLENYTVSGEEFGKIPMTAQRFARCSGKVFYVGSAGGASKASTGYTFSRILRQVRGVVECLERGESLEKIAPGKAKHCFYDGVLLDVLSHNRFPGRDIFSRMFRRNSGYRVLSFLDERAALADDLKIIFSCPVFPFLRAFFSYSRVWL
ncbi:lycopene cyclase [Fulvitalea axinellae]|uniref:Lycopene cyclase n=1 Tax=Fulvitalea axinellae TaxID=1182444 RepID=A0AAU9CSK9_9BACT|nr:lycopene cyclase [Fulvitalea axinellae]